MPKSAPAPRAALAVLLAVLGVLVLAAPARAGTCDPILDPLCSPSSSEPEPPASSSSSSSTSTTEQVTTTDPPRTTQSTATTVPPPTTAAQIDEEIETTTSTSRPDLLEEGPPTIPGETPTTPVPTTAVSASGDTNETARQVALVIGGLLVLAAVFGLITFWYWRWTSPLAPARAPAAKKAAPPASQRAGSPPVHPDDAWDELRPSRPSRPPRRAPVRAR